EVEELVRGRPLNQYVLGRWRKFLRESKEADEPVFRLWHRGSAIPEKEFATKWPSARRTAKGNAVIEAEVDAKAIASLRDLAGAYAVVLGRYDRPEPFGDPEADRLRGFVRGPKSPIEVPLEEFELI